MSEKQPVFEAEARLLKTPKVTPEPKPEDAGNKPARTRKPNNQRTFSRETVERLIDWFKQE
jgi:hypothetical protein